ncbi:signal peptidase I [Rudaeicoccus suwonensis]|uniref:signal peptidase I n=1 Tax=Rudaeicoccus suwonensis TaxID=657409 RepID=UPI001FE53FD1|nr:signal peptidase I [Rudaeicoccus suwonensis]
MTSERHRLPGQPGKAGQPEPPVDPEATLEMRRSDVAAVGSVDQAPPRQDAPGVDQTAVFHPVNASGTPGPQEDEEHDTVLKSPARRFFGAVRELSVVVVVALVLSLIVKTFLFQPFWIPSGSMENTLVPGDRVIVSKLTPGVFSLKRGDVIVFKDPGGWLDTPVQKHSGLSGLLIEGLQFVGLYPAGDDHLIKRVIGLPGDHVRCCNAAGQITVNGVGLNEPYIYPGGGTDQVQFNITVPPGDVWVMGDHRGDSADSRFHDNGTGATGSVPEKDIVGRAVAIVWPLDRMSWLSNFSSTFDRVPEP